MLTKSTIAMSNEMNTSIGYIIGSTRRVILKELGSVFLENNIPITIEQYIFLVALRNQKGEVTQQDMANHICKDKSAILRTIDVLEKQGLVQRTQVSGDRRKNTLSFTAKCEELFGSIAKLETKTMETLTAGINREEYDTAIRVLQHIQQNANNLTINK